MSIRVEITDGWCGAMFVANEARYTEGRPFGGSLQVRVGPQQLEALRQQIGPRSKPLSREELAHWTKLLERVSAQLETRAQDLALAGIPLGSDLQSDADELRALQVTLARFA